MSGLWVLLQGKFSSYFPFLPNPLQPTSSTDTHGFFSAIGTPLFFDHPQSMALIDMEKDTLLPPEEVAKAMMALLSDSKYPPGTVLEVGDVGQWREVMLFNDDGPKGRATVLRKRAADQVDEVKKFLENDRAGK
jgi:hypothetical protein